MIVSTLVNHLSQEGEKGSRVNKPEIPTSKKDDNILTENHANYNVGIIGFSAGDAPLGGAIIKQQ